MALLFFSFFSITIVVYATLILVKGLNQQNRDGGRQTYVLSFPTDLDADRILAWVRSVSGTKKSWWNGLRGKSTIAFELRSTPQGIQHRIKIPWQNAADYIIPQLRLQGVRVTPDDDPPHRKWTKVVELGLAHSARTLSIYNHADAAATILTSTAYLHENETVLVQLIVTPTSRRKLPIYREAQSIHPGIRQVLIKGNAASRDEVNERRQKLSEPNFLAVLRIAVVANTDVRADHLVHRVYQALASLQGPSTRFIFRRWVTQKLLKERVDKAATSAVILPMQLSASEVGVLTLFPIGNPNVAGLPPTRARHIPASELVPRTGIVLGKSNMPGHERDIAVSFEDAAKHIHIMGGTGCLHPDTPIYDPVADTTLSVYERYLLAEPFHVFSMDGEKIVIAEAKPPVEYRRVGMYELRDREHRIVVTGEHRVWNGKSYVEVRQLARADACRLPSISEFGLSRLRANARHSMRTGADSPADYRWSCRLCGLPLRQVVDNVLAFVPSRDDVPAPCFGGSGADGQAHTPGHNHPYRRCDLTARSSSSHPSSRVLAARALREVGTSSSPWMSRPSSVESGAGSDRTCRELRTHRSGTASTACTGVPGPALHGLGDSVGESSDYLSAPTSLSRKRYARHSPTEVSYPLSPLLEPCPDLLFNQYFKISTFRVRQASAETYYDFHVPGLGNYLAEGLIHHNSGKSALMGNMFRQVVSNREANYGAILIERKDGELFNAALDYIPPERINDTIVLDLGDQAHPLAFNVLDQGDPFTIIDEMTELIAGLADGGNGVWIKKVSYHALRTLITRPGATLIDLPALLIPNEDEKFWRDDLIRGLRGNDEYKDLRMFWQELDNLSPPQRDQMIRPLLDRYWKLTTRAAIRNIIGQSTSSFQLSDVLSQNKIFLLNLSNVPKETAELFGSIVYNLVWDLGQQVRPKSPNFLFLDEFQSFVKLPIDPEDMLAKARAFKLPMVMANQHLGQLPSSLVEALQPNSKTKIMFQTGAKDGRTMSHELGVDATDLQHLGGFEAAVRVGTPGGSSPPLTMSTNPPAPGYGRANQVKHVSRQQYSRHVGEVEKEIVQRRQVQPKPRLRRDFDDDPGWPEGFGT